MFGNRQFLFFLVFLFFSLNLNSQTNLGDPNKLDIYILNSFILKEVNKLRKNVDAEPLEVRSELQLAADDHVAYMKRKQRLSHFQRFNQEKKTPKNRVDFYGEQFAIVGENVQLNNLNYGASIKDKKNPPVTTYEQLAAKLVLAWRNSPGHYANMINPDYKSTFCSVCVTPTGQVYACQLFGGSVYFDKHEELNDTINYKPQKDRVCKTCTRRPPAGWITVTEDRQIHFQYVTPPSFHFSRSRMRFYNLFYDGIAADIVLKSQYPCDSASYFNGKMGVRGIPLEPVYRKDFGFIGLFQTDIYLGQVPDYVQEDFEVNLTVVQRKRTCTNTMYYVIPSEYHVNIPLYFEFDARELKTQKRDTNNITEKVVFEKGKTTLPDDVLNKLVALMKSDTAKIYRVDITGYASIEGTSTLNLSLFQERTKYISDYLISKGIDSTLIFKKSAENFVDFRSDIAGTKLHKWLKFSDEDLKNEVNKNGMSDSLEYLLKNHRYVLVDILTIRKSEFKLGKDTIQFLLENAILEKKNKEASKYLNAQYEFVRKHEMSLDELNATKIPKEKKFIRLLHDRAVMNYYIDSLNPKRNLILKKELDTLLELDKSNKKINTSLAILDYYLFSKRSSYKAQNRFF
jgi:outer membrane protein OmpA-like peptidoglycan-associated protein